MPKVWMPLYVGDITADTMHLGPTEFGIYMRLIFHCWQHGTIPNNDRQLAIIAHCDTRLWWRYKETVLQFFDSVDASTWHQKRVTTELQRYREISNVRKERALQQHSKRSASAVQVHTQSQSQSQSHIKKEGNGVDEEGKTVAATQNSDRTAELLARWEEKRKRQGWID